MATIAKLILSGGSDGRQIKIVETGSPGTTLHTAHATKLHELWLWITNSDSVDRKVTIELGGVTSPDDLIEMTIPAEDGPHLVVPGIPLTGSVVIKAFGAAANVLLASGYVNQITA